MRSVKTISWMLVLAAVCAAQAHHKPAAKAKPATPPANTHYYGAVDLGSRGTKAVLYSFVTEEEGRNPVSVFSDVKITTLVSSMKEGQFTKEGLADAADSVKKVVDAMKAEADKRKITVDVYYVVGSSGVAKGKNKDELVAAVKAATGIDMDFVDAAHEGYYGLLSAVPLSRRESSLYVDIGSGNGKLGCLVGDTDFGNFKAAEIPFGSASTVNEAVKRNSKDVNAGIASVMGDVDSKYEEQSRNVPCLRNRPRIYWTGGAAWATATFMHPEKELNGWVVITKRDLEAFVARLKTKNWNQRPLVFNFPKDMPLDRQKMIRAKAHEERYGKNGVENVFVREQILSGVSIMKAVLDSSNPSASIRFVRSGNYIYGYALDKFKADNPGARTAAPAGSLPACCQNASDPTACRAAKVKEGLADCAGPTAKL